MKGKFAESVKIIELKNFDILGVSGDIIFQVKDKRLSAFITDFKSHGPFFVGEKCIVILTLLTTNLEIINEPIKTIENGQRYDDFCILSGKIIELIEIEKNQYDGIIDCGIYVQIGLKPKLINRMKIGEFIRAEGRLDIIKIKENI